MLLATADGKALARGRPVLRLPSLAESEAAAPGWQLARKGQGCAWLCVGAGGGDNRLGQRVG